MTVCDLIMCHTISFGSCL